MNLFLTLISIAMTAILAMQSNEMPGYILVPLLIIDMIPAGVAVIKSELRDMELEERIKRLENAEQENKE